MVMEYEVLETEDPNFHLIRVYGNSELCGKWRIHIEIEYRFLLRLDGLGWTERT